MSSLSGKFDKKVGVCIEVTVAPANMMREGTDNWNMYRALLDTGSLKSSISDGVAKDLNLTNRGGFNVHSANGMRERPAYSVDLAIQFESKPAVVRRLEVLEFTPGPDSDFEVLIGRDILCQGVFTMSFDGHFTFSI